MAVEKREGEWARVSLTCPSKRTRRKKTQCRPKRRVGEKDWAQT